MGRIVLKLSLKVYAVMQWYTQAVNITNNLKVTADFTVPVPSTTNYMTCKWHVDDSNKFRYDIILGRYLLT